MYTFLIPQNYAKKKKTVNSFKTVNNNLYGDESPKGAFD